MTHARVSSSALNRLFTTWMVSPFRFQKAFRLPARVKMFGDSERHVAPETPCALWDTDCYA
jgi:hypothetical protein